jgi:hypothetical protein
MLDLLIAKNLRLKSHLGIESLNSKVSLIENDIPMCDNEEKRCLI